MNIKCNVSITPPMKKKTKPQKNRNVPAHVSHFPMKEFGNINQLQQYGHRHTVLYIVIRLQFHVLVPKRDNGDGPEHHTEAAIGHLFDIELKDPGIQFGAPIKILHDRSRRPAVQSGRHGISLDDQSEANNKGQYIHTTQNVSKFVINHRGAKRGVEGVESHQSDNGNDVTRYTIGGIGRPMPVGCRRGGKGRSRDDGHQYALEGNETDDHLPRRTIVRRRPQVVQLLKVRDRRGRLDGGDKGVEIAAIDGTDVIIDHTENGGDDHEEDRTNRVPTR